MARWKGPVLFVPLLVVLALATAWAAAPAGSTGTVASLLRKAGLSFAPLEGRTDTWYLTCTGLDHLKKIEVYVWARQGGYVTIFAGVFRLTAQADRAFLCRLLELNNSMLPFKYVMREEPGSQDRLVECQADLPLRSLAAGDLRFAIEELVTVVDGHYLELKALL